MPQATAIFNFAATGGMLGQSQVDAGARLGLSDALERPWFSCDARGFVSMPSYDAGHRVVSASIAHSSAPEPVVVTRVAYGECLSLASARSLNLRGQLLESFSQAAWNSVQGATLAGAPLAGVRYLTLDYAGNDDGMPAVAIPELDGSVPRNAGLQSSGYSGALQRRDALGRILEAANLQGNVLRTSFLLSGMPDMVEADGITCLSSFRYNARAQLLAIGKGEPRDGSPLFSTAFRYDPKTYRCRQRYASTSSAFISANENNAWIDGSGDPGRRQDIRYVLDPGGNVAGLQDAYPAIVFNDARVAQSDYGYDALYRMLTASGFESATASPIDGSPGSACANAIPYCAGATLAPYRQYYTYDDGGNITRLVHDSNGSVSRSRSTALKVSNGSNRSITQAYYQSLGGSDEGTTIDDAFFTNENIFDACGNQLKNANLHALVWNYQNQAIRVSYPAPDDSGSTVTEYSVHTASGGARSRKVVETRNADGVLTQLKTVTYLGDVDATASYTQADDSGIGYDGENVSNALLQAEYRELRIRLGHAQQLRILSGVLEAGGQQTTTTWYSLGDQIDSCQTELGESGSIDSYQAYYPYGGTAICALGRTSADGSLALKVRQYSGELKDDSGLSYYGFRSYDGATFRWTKPDPSGFKGSGLNWYRMVAGNPVTYRDERGLVRWLTLDVGPFAGQPLVQIFNLEELAYEWLIMPPKVQLLIGEDHRHRDASIALMQRFYEQRLCDREAYYGVENGTLHNVSPERLRAFFKSVRNAFQHYGMLADRGWPIDQVQWYLNCELIRHEGIPVGTTVGDIVAGYVGCAASSGINADDPHVQKAIRKAVKSTRYFVGSTVEMALENLKQNSSGQAIVGLAHLLDQAELFVTPTPDGNLVVHPEDNGLITACARRNIPFMAAIPIKTLVHSNASYADIVEVVKRGGENYVTFFAELESASRLGNAPSHLSRHDEAHQHGMCLVIKPRMFRPDLLLRQPALSGATAHPDHPGSRRGRKRTFSEFAKDQIPKA